MSSPPREQPMAREQPKANAAPSSDVEASLRSEVEHLGRIVDEQERTVGALRHELFLHTTAIGWRLQLRLEPLRKWMLSVPGLRQLYRTSYRALEHWVDEGYGRVFRQAGVKLGRLVRGKRFLVEDRDRRSHLMVEDEYHLWIRLHGESPTSEAMREQIARFTTTPLVSVLTVVDEGNAAAVESVRTTLKAQAYERWELCVAPTWGDAFRKAAGDYIAFLDAGDELAPAALVELVRRLQAEPGLDIVYSDEDSITVEGRREEPMFKPDWSPDLLLSTNYLQHFGIFRRRLATEVGAFSEEAGLAQVYDLALRVSERASGIAHVPKVLYHNRRKPTTVDAVLARHAANRDECRAIVAALGRRKTPGRTEAVFARTGSRCYATRFDLQQRPLVSIVIPTKDKRSLLQTTIESIWARTDYDRYEIIVVDNESSDPDTLRYLDSLAPRCQVLKWREPFNYSAINNFGVKHARGEQILFLNNDVEVIAPDWLTAMLEHAQRPEVGVVGARLLYASGRIQHAGVVVGINRVAANAFRSWPGETIGNPRLADLTRNCSAVTGACMMVPRRIFDEVGGFDENLRVVLNDVDLCLKIRERGLLVVYTPHALLYHYEGSSRGRLHPPPDERVFEARWKDFLDRGDPYYSPNLSDKHDDWRIRVDFPEDDETD